MTRYFFPRFNLPNVLASFSFVLAAAAAPVAASRAEAPGTVYTLSNAVAGNAVLAFDSTRDGSLRPAGTYPTGGSGSGGGLGNAGALALSRDGHWLLAVNAGSNELTVFARERGRLQVADKAATGGVRPVSVAIHGDLVYVLNAGSDNLVGFNVDYHGRLTPIAGSTRALSGRGTGAAQAEFSPDGESLIVTEKATNLVLIYPVDADGLLDRPVVQASPAPTPFGFAFGKRSQFFVSEAAGGAAGKSTLSSYRLNDDGTAALITASAAVPGQSAACWVAVTKNGRFAFVSNTGSGTVTAFSVSRDGALGLVAGNTVGGNTGAGSGPTDLALSRDGRFLFVLAPGNGTLRSFRVGNDGRLTLVVDSTGGIPAAATGLVSR